MHVDNFCILISWSIALVLLAVKGLLMERLIYKCILSYLLSILYIPGSPWSWFTNDFRRMEEGKKGNEVRHGRWRICNMLHGSQVFYVMSSTGFFRISHPSWCIFPGSSRPSKIVSVKQYSTCLLCSSSPFWPFMHVNPFSLFPFFGTDVSFLYERVLSYQILFLLVSVLLSLYVQLSLLLLITQLYFCMI